jgi:ribonucleoside-diphosphate reductase alpha chain
MGHLKMMGAVQPFISGAISKTVNVPKDATPAEIQQAYTESWRLGVKAISIYRDGSKRTQPLSTGKESPADMKAANDAAAAPAKVNRRRLPDERQAITHHFRILDHDGYITVGMYEDGSPGEVFMKMAKQGSTVSGLMDSLAICMSLALQHGVPLSTMANKLSHMRFDPSGFTGNPEIPSAKSIVDYLVRWLSAKFLTEDEKRSVGIITDQMRAELEGQVPDGQQPVAIEGSAQGAVVIETAPAEPSAPKEQTSMDIGLAQSAGLSVQLDQDGAICGSCGWTMVRSGSCYKCMNCGSTSGCS